MRVAALLPGAALAAAGALFLLFFRPTFAFSTFGQMDPHCYFGQLLQLLGRSASPCGSEAHLPGTAWVWWPLGAVAHLLAEGLGGERDNALRMAVGFTALGCWLGAFAACFKLCGRNTARALTWILAAPALYYAVVRTHLSHAPELLFSSLAALALGRRRLRWALAFSLALCTVRYQGVLWVGAVAWVAHHERSSLRGLALAASLGLALYALYVLWVPGYNEIRLPYLLQGITVSRLTWVLFGRDWGLLWTAPWWLAVGGAALAFRRRLSPEGTAALGVMAGCGLVALAWRGNGNDFGYRYLITSFPALWLLAARAPWPASLDRPLGMVAALNAAVVTYLTWIYRTQPAFTPTPVPPGQSPLPNFLTDALAGLFSVDTWLSPLSLSPLPQLYCSWAGCGERLALMHQWGLAGAVVLAMVGVLYGLRQISATRPQ